MPHDLVLGFKHKEKVRFHIIQNPRRGGARGLVYTAFKSTRSTPISLKSKYVYKPAPKSDFIMFAEAVAGDLYTYLSSVNFPKSRVIVDFDLAIASHKPVATVSKLFDGEYVPARDLTVEQLRYILAEFKDELAIILTALLLMRDGDGHAGNWGAIIKNGHIMHIIKIDHDMAFFDLVARDHELDSEFDTLDEECGEFLTTYPNFYIPRARAHCLTTYDVVALPRLEIARPHNWPEKLFEMKGLLTEFYALVDDPVFIEHKFLTILKMLMISKKQVEAICHAHAFNLEDKKRLESYINALIIDLRSVISCVSEFRDFVISKRELIIDDLNTQVLEYNSKYSEQIHDLITGYYIGEAVKIKYRESGFIMPPHRVRNRVARIIEAIHSYTANSFVIFDSERRILELQRAIQNRQWIERLIRQPNLPIQLLRRLRAENIFYGKCERRLIALNTYLMQLRLIASMQSHVVATVAVSGTNTSLSRSEHPELTPAEVVACAQRIMTTTATQPSATIENSTLTLYDSLRSSRRLEESADMLVDRVTASPPQTARG